MQIRFPRLLQLLSDVRIGATVVSPKGAFVLDPHGELLLANRAALDLLRVADRAAATKIIAAERSPLAPMLRELSRSVPDTPQACALPLRIGPTRRLVEFTASRIVLPDAGDAFLMVAREPAGLAPGAADAAAAIFDGEGTALALFDGNGARLYANEMAQALLGAAESLTEVVPGVHGAIARARAEGSADVQFGVLKVLLRRIGAEGNLFLITAFLAPAREETETIAPAVREAPPQIEVPAAIPEPESSMREPAPASSETRSEASQTPTDTPEEAPLTQEEQIVEAPAAAEIAEARLSEMPHVAAEEVAAEENVETDEEPREEISPAEESLPTLETASATTEPVKATEPAPLPRRFVWQTDAEGRFTSVSPELAAVVGELPAAIVGLDWNEAGAQLDIDGTTAVAEAVARRDTWSGVSVHWPIEGSELVRPVDLAALPAFDRERRFLGYRGFGVFRDPTPRPAKAPAPVREEPPAITSKPLEKAEPGVLPRFAEPAPKVRMQFGKRTEKIVPLHKPETPRPSLTPVERSAFREIAKAIGARMQRVNVPAPGKTNEPTPPPAPVQALVPIRSFPGGERAILDRLPVGVVVHRGGHILYANRAVLEWTGTASVNELADGGLERLFANGQGFADETGESSRPVALRGPGATTIPVDARLISATWDGETALVYFLSRASVADHERLEATELALRDAEASTREMRAILDTATDGVALLDREGHVLGMNRSAEALFGFDSGEIEGRNFTVLFAPESHRAALDYLDGLASNGVASVLNDGREVIGRVREGGLIPLFMTLGRVGDHGEKFCAVFRDITQWKRAEEELVQARRQAERANSAKSEFLAKISHEIRTPLNAIIGFAEVMMEERLGPVANERYREYLKDIHTSGEHLISLVNDLLDLSKIEAGKLDLVFSSVDLNEIASQSMALMQPQANRERIIIRTALSTDLPPVVADARSIRQIVLNLLSNSIRFTPPGGQVIVSTTLTDDGEVHLRVRDTGIGMTEAEIKTALEPFRQVATTGRGKEGGTGLGLPLTKALAEANRASFSIKSTKNAGTLVEIAFPSTRVLAE